MKSLIVEMSKGYCPHCGKYHDVALWFQFNEKFQSFQLVSTVCKSSVNIKIKAIVKKKNL